MKHRNVELLLLINENFMLLWEIQICIWEDFSRSKLNDLFVLFNFFLLFLYWSWTSLFQIIFPESISSALIDGYLAEPKLINIATILLHPNIFLLRLLRGFIGWFVLTQLRQEIIQINLLTFVSLWSEIR